MVPLFVLACLSVLAASLVSGSLSATVMSCMVLLLGVLYCRTIGELSVRRYALKIVLVVFAFVSFLAIMHYMDYRVDWIFYSLEGCDEYNFWMLSETLKSYPSISAIFHECYSDSSFGIEWPGYGLYIGTLAYLAEHYVDGNDFLMQLYGSVLFYCLSVVPIFKVFNYYFGEKPAFRYVILFMLFFPCIKISYSFLRDVIVFFFFAEVFSIILTKEFSVKNLLGLSIIMFLVWQIRVEHGLFCLIFIAYYLYKQFRSYWALGFVVGIGVLSLLLGVFRGSFEDVLLSMDRYSERTSNLSLSVQDSLGAAIYNLPSPVREIASFFNSQLQPFPSWHETAVASNPYKAVVGLLAIVYEFLWFVVFFASLYWLIFGKKLELLPKELRWMVLIFVAFIFFNISNPILRRMVCMYPFLYLSFAYLRENLSMRDYSRGRNGVAVFWMSIVIVYFLLKM